MESDSDYSEDDLKSHNDGFKIPDPSFVVIAIDTHPDMFIKRDNQNTTPFQTCLTACYKMAMELLFYNTRGWNQFAILLATDDPQLSCLIPFHNNMLETIKTLEEKKDMPLDTLKQEYERKGDTDLGQFFLTCVRKFNELKGNFNKRTLIYMTDDDNPPKGDKNGKYLSLNNVKSLKEHWINLELVNFKVDFSYELFYNELFAVMEQTPDETVVADVDGLVYKLLSFISNRFSTTKTYFYPLVGNQKKYLALIEVKPIRECRLNANAYRSVDGQEVENTFKSFNDEGELITACDFELEGDPPAKISRDDLAKCKENNFSLGYTLLGIFNKPAFDKMIHISTPIFIKVHPKESLLYFNEMWNFCFKNGKVFVCVQKRRVDAAMKFVELVPKCVSNEKVFLVRQIPFYDEIDEIDSDMMGEEKQEENEKTLKDIDDLMDGLTIAYEPSMFSDPELSKKFAYLRAKLLDRGREEICDNTLDLEAIDRKISNVVESLEKSLEGGDWITTAVKRGQEKSSQAPKTKRSRR